MSYSNIFHIFRRLLIFTSNMGVARYPRNKQQPKKGDPLVAIYSVNHFLGLYFSFTSSIFNGPVHQLGWRSYLFRWEGSLGSIYKETNFLQYIKYLYIYIKKLL